MKTTLFDVDASEFTAAFELVLQTTDWNKFHPFMKLMKLKWYKGVDSAKEMARKNFESVLSRVQTKEFSDSSKISVSCGCLRVEFEIVEYEKAMYVLVCRIAFDPYLVSSHCYTLS